MYHASMRRCSDWKADMESMNTAPLHALKALLPSINNHQARMFLPGRDQYIVVYAAFV